MGLDKEQVINLRHLGKLGKNADAFKTEILKQTSIQAASFTNNLLPGTDNTTVFREKGSDKDYIFGQYNVDYDYLHVLKIELKEGRFFSRDFPNDTLAVVLNEAAVKEFGWELSTAVGREVLNFNLGPKPVETKVVGVVKDYNFESMKSKIRPLILTMYPTANVLMIRYEGSAQQAIETTKQTWLKYASGEPFEYTFLDQNFDALFHSEMRLKNIFTVFSGIAIFVACLGLFALAAFTTEQRTKEIGIRKALGTSTARLTFILSQEFTILVIISFVPAATAAWYFSSYWLNGFAYRTEVSVWLFIAGGVGALLVAWVTVGYQSIKAARSNPVNSLRYE
jgi:putative ABC transport system permease protein